MYICFSLSVVNSISNNKFNFFISPLGILNSIVCFVIVSIFLKLSPLYLSGFIMSNILVISLVKFSFLNNPSPMATIYASFDLVAYLSKDGLFLGCLYALLLLLFEFFCLVFSCNLENKVY